MISSLHSRSMFKGGGYTLNFRRGARATKLHLKRLEKATWLDVNTRSVFVEFTLYNANVNLFASVVLLIEFMATGGALPRYEVKVRRIIQWYIYIYIFIYKYIYIYIYIYTYMCVFIVAGAFAICTSYHRDFYAHCIVVIFIRCYCDTHIVAMWFLSGADVALNCHYIIIAIWTCTVVIFVTLNLQIALLWFFKCHCGCNHSSIVISDAIANLRLYHCDFFSGVPSV